MLTFYLFRLAGWAAPRLPLRLLYWIADRSASLAFRTSGDRRRILETNVRHVLGSESDQSQIEQIARKVFRLGARNMVDFFRLPATEASTVERLVTLRGWEHLESALARGKGVIVSSIHFGSPDVAVQILAIRGMRPLVLHERLEPPRLYEYVSGVRACLGITFVPTGDTSALKRLFRTLRSNGIIGVAADRDVTDSGRRVTFFGAPARLPDGHVTLALRTGAPILMTFCHRRADDTYAITIEPPMILEPTGNAEADVEAGMSRVIAIMERYIRATPDQWTYFQPIWLD